MPIGIQKVPIGFQKVPIEIKKMPIEIKKVLIDIIKVKTAWCGKVQQLSTCQGSFLNMIK
ncbi:hypothetical protein AM500_17975 [Bacillus sp. FJAT-18017]|nr:hypothetical protein AM500_17975 [Bacillus sp. FJAT-18017]